MQWIYGIEELITYVKENDLSLGFVHISEWEKNMTKNIVESVKTRFSSNNIETQSKILSTTIPNPIFDEMINEVLENKPERKQHKFIFHAAWARGGNVAVDAVRKLNFDDSEFHAFDYLLATHNHQDKFFNLHNGVDKKTLFTNLAESDYFIYPLYTPYQDVHKDTFSCVAAEAIALGAIVVTYPLGALPENFDGFCQWLDFPDGVDPKKMQEEALSKDLEGKFKITDNIVSKIIKFNVNKVGGMWTDFINNLL
jgi:glycosyltransferase involved in cell wall biosynthesis